MVTLVKLGGSLITDKTRPLAFRQDVMSRLAQEIADTMQTSMPIIIGHGSGSFGHVEAQKHNTMDGVTTTEQWRGFARVATRAAELNYHVASALQAVDVPIIRFQPSASSIAVDGSLREMALYNIEKALANELVPLVYGDVAFDEQRGGTITSTETVFTYLVNNLAHPVTRILLLGEVDGVYDNVQNIIPQITSKNFEQIEPLLKPSRGVDVTGGMLSKVRDMLTLAIHPPYPTIRILNGLVPDRLKDALLDRPTIGTTIRHTPTDQPDDEH